MRPKIGYDKCDILSQSGIGHIKKAVRLVERNQRRKVDIHRTKKFMRDARINDQLK